MKKKYKYKKDGKYYHIDIPENEQEQFLIDNPDAEEVDTSTGGWMMDMDVYGLTDDEKKGFFEYFSCKNGQPMGAKNFSWSAALYLDLMLNKN